MSIITKRGEQGVFKYCGPNQLGVKYFSSAGMQIAKMDENEQKEVMEEILKAVSFVAETSEFAIAYFN